MKIYTLSYYSETINGVMGNYSSFEKAKDALAEEAEACNEVIDYANGVEYPGHGYGRYPIKDDTDHAYYEIDCNPLNDEDEEEEEEYDDEYDDYNDDDEDDDEEYDDDEDYDDEWDEDDDEEDYEDGEDDESEADDPWEILRLLLRKGLYGIGIIVGE